MKQGRSIVVEQLLKEDEFTTEDLLNPWLA